MCAAGYDYLGFTRGRKVSSVLRLAAFSAAWFIIVDFVTDGFTTTTYHQEWQEGTLPYWFYQLGVTFMILPSLGSTIVQVVAAYKSGYWGWYDVGVVLVFGPLYSLSTPLLAIHTTGKALLCGDIEDQEKEKRWLSVTKLFEVIFEAIPQVCLTYVYFNYDGWPWEREGKSWVPFLSNLTSTLTVGIGFVTGINAYKNGGFQNMFGWE